MKLFSNLRPEVLQEVFYKKPSLVTEESPNHIKAFALGATLYMPATKENLFYKIVNRGYSSVVLCLEDAIREEHLSIGEANITEALSMIEEGIHREAIDIDDLPMIFIRVRNIEQFSRFVHALKPIRYVTGFVFPKFDTICGPIYLKILQEISEQHNKLFFGMPILETKSVIHGETRISELLHIKYLLDEYRKYILNVRIGGTDFSGYYGLRRTLDQTIYDLRVVSDTMTDILNIFARSHEGFTVSGAVWEYFSTQNNETKWKSGLIKEVMMDQNNGMIGKTVIHPVQVPVVNALYAVPKERYLDAVDIIESQGGVLSSQYQNKMNETKPHTFWAQQTISRAHVYGVLNDDINFIDIIEREKNIHENRSITYIRSVGN